MNLVDEFRHIDKKSKIQVHEEDSDILITKDENGKKKVLRLTPQEMEFVCDVWGWM